MHLGLSTFCVAGLQSIGHKKHDMTQKRGTNPAHTLGGKKRMI
jgi:hypothetical protein